MATLIDHDESLPSDSQPQPSRSANVIRPIDQASVHRICSGQVVVDLSIAVKELVENSLDAGANSVEIRLKEYALDAIEIVDNGCGIEKQNYAAIALKHWTSKIRDFSDLPHVTSFGFRGEALSSLCALSRMSVTTCRADEKVGTLLIFNHEGELVEQKPTSRNQGTTILLEDLFSTLPVRRKAFEKNLKREYAKTLALLQAYAIISDGVRITCSNQTRKGAKSTVISTQASDTFLQRVSSVFGHQQASKLQPLQLSFSLDPNDKTEAENDEGEEEEKQQDQTAPSAIKSVIKVSGYISKMEPNCGRSASDRQFVFLNGRPVELPKLTRLINEVYRSFNSRAAYPVFFLDLTLPAGWFDVNVTPDKRTIFIREETKLLERLKELLMKEYEPTQSTYRVQSLTSFLTSSSSTATAPEESGLMIRSHSEPVQPRSDKQHPLARIMSLDSATIHKPQSSANMETLDPVVQPTASLSHEASVMTPSQTGDDDDDWAVDLSDRAPSSSSLSRSSSASVSSATPPSMSSSKFMGVLSSPFPSSSTSTSRNVLAAKPATPNIFQDFSFHKGSSSSKFITTPPANAKAKAKNQVNGMKKLDLFVKRKREEHEEERLGAKDDDDDDQAGVAATDENGHQYEQKETGADRDLESGDYVSAIEVDQPPPSHVQNSQSRSTAFDWRTIQSRFQSLCSSSSSSASTDLSPSDRVLQRGDLGSETAATLSESDMKRVLSKDDFRTMSSNIIGQFNLGFIIARLHDDLFVIDQHATDEKYRFETLQKSTTIKTQPLISPLKVEVSPANEATILNHLHVFKANGFDFLENDDSKEGNHDEDDPSSASSRTLRLKTVPFSKNTVFGVSDIHQLCALLTDQPGVMHRLPKIRHMFASRACRSAVMVGDPLSREQMAKIVQHMSDMEHPWACPHGRPTMRHLVDLRQAKHMIERHRSNMSPTEIVVSESAIAESHPETPQAAQMDES